MHSCVRKKEVTEKKLTVETIQKKSGCVFKWFEWTKEYIYILYLLGIYGIYIHIVRCS